MQLPPLPDVQKLSEDFRNARADLRRAIDEYRKAASAYFAALSPSPCFQPPVVTTVAKLLLEHGGRGYQRAGFSSLHLQRALAELGEQVAGTTAHALFTDLGYRCIGRTRSPDGFTRVWIPADQPDVNPTHAIRHLIP